MEINVTLVIQALVFATFVWFTMKFVWPPLSKALEDRQQKIAEGLAAAERGRKELELAHLRATDEIKAARLQAHEIVEKAGKRAAQIVDEAKNNARIESQKVFENAQEQINQELNRAKVELRNQVASLAVAGAEKILKREVNQKANDVLFDDLLEEITNV